MAIQDSVYPLRELASPRARAALLETEQAKLERVAQSGDSRYELSITGKTRSMHVTLIPLTTRDDRHEQGYYLILEDVRRGRPNARPQTPAWLGEPVPGETQRSYWLDYERKPQLIVGFTVDRIQEALHEVSKMYALERE